MTVFVLLNDHGNLLGVYSSVERCDEVMRGLEYKKITDEYGEISYEKEEKNYTGEKLIYTVFLYAFELDE